MTKEKQAGNWHLVFVRCANCGHMALIWLPWKDLRDIGCGECEARSWSVISYMEDNYHGDD